jgi:hypothetical protein
VTLASGSDTTVRVVGAFVTVAVIAVPLDESVIVVRPAVSETIAMYVAAGPDPIVVDRPGVSVRVAPPSVTDWPSTTVGCVPGAGVMLGLGITVLWGTCCGFSSPGAI